MAEERQVAPGLVEVRVCVTSGLRVSLIPGDRCRAHGAAPTMCKTALREVPAGTAERLWRSR